MAKTIAQQYREWLQGRSKQTRGRVSPIINGMETLTQIQERGQIKEDQFANYKNRLLAEYPEQGEDIESRYNVYDSSINQQNYFDLQRIELKKVREGKETEKQREYYFNLGQTQGVIGEDVIFEDWKTKSSGTPQEDYNLSVAEAKRKTRKTNKETEKSNIENDWIKAENLAKEKGFSIDDVTKAKTIYDNPEQFRKAINKWKPEKIEEEKGIKKSGTKFTAAEIRKIGDYEVLNIVEFKDDNKSKLHILKIFKEIEELKDIDYKEDEIEAKKEELKKYYVFNKEKQMKQMEELSKKEMEEYKLMADVRKKSKKLKFDDVIKSKKSIIDSLAKKLGF